jgi:hypothetical protein
MYRVFLFFKNQDYIFGNTMVLNFTRRFGTHKHNIVSESKELCKTCCFLIAQ